MHFTTDNEKELLRRVAGGDEPAFRALFDEYWDNIYGVAFTLTKSREHARDMVQEIFLKVWLLREELAEKDSFRNFLFIISRNHIISELRKKSRETAFSDHLAGYFRESPFHADHQALYNESASIIRQALDQLPEQQRLVYQLGREQGLSQEQIAERLGITKNTVKTHMSRALAAIRQFLEERTNGVLLVICVLEAFL